ncbi:MAG: LysE family transporter [Candidatus Micrarchaeota archaeon]|nr:LysE family transporter [Candidatus Micrarchaeota archaeon]
MGYLESVLLGFSFAALPGPIFFELVRRTLTKGFWSGALVSVGEFLANLSILLLTFFGLSAFLSSPTVKMLLFLFGGAVLVWVGCKAFRIKNEDLSPDSRKEVSKSNSFFVGFILGISSPLAIAVWITVGGAYIAQFSSQSIALINIFLCALGVMLFFFVLTSIIHVSKHRISEKYVILSSKVFGTILVLYGIYFWYLLSGLLRAG